MNEHSYIRSIHRHLDPNQVYAWKINDNYAGGVADAFYSAKGGDILFAEYKYRKNLPKNGATQIIPDCSKLQLTWLRKRHEENKPVVVILGSPIGSVVFTKTSWEQGITTHEFTQQAMRQKEIARIIAEHCTGATHVYTNEACYHPP